MACRAGALLTAGLVLAFAGQAAYGAGAHTYSDPAGASMFLRVPSSYYVEVPVSLQENQTAHVRYSFEWDVPGGQADPPRAGDRAGQLALFAPEEVRVIHNDKRFVSKWADAYAPHHGTMYVIDIPYSESGATGSIGLELERPLHHDRDMLAVGGHVFQLQRTGGGAALAEAAALAGGDLHQMWLMSDALGHDEDPLGRYDVTYDRDVEHEPLQAPAAREAEPAPGGKYVERERWPAYAALLRDVVRSGGSTAPYLAAPEFSREFSDEFVKRYPDLAPSYRGARSAPVPPQVVVWGTYTVDGLLAADSAIAGATACAFDSSANSVQLLSNLYGDACGPTDVSGNFALLVNNDDPDDDTGIDLRMGILLESDRDGIHMVKPFDRNTYRSIDTVRHNNLTARALDVGTVVAPHSFHDAYEGFAAAVLVHEKFDGLGYHAPPVAIEASRYAQARLYCPADQCGTDLDTIKATLGDTAGTMRGYGHHVQHSVYESMGSHFPVCRIPGLTAVTSPACAWAGGWAWFAAALTQDNPLVTAYGGTYVDLEAGRLHDGHEGTSEELPHAAGSYSEIWPAAALWDIYDSANEPGDGVSGNASSIMGAFGDYPAQDVLQWQISWDDRGLQDIGGIMEHNNITPDTAPPAVVPPPDKVFEATGPETALDEGDYGRASATDGVDPDPEISSNAPDSFSLGDTVITWKATDHWGNMANATQTVTVRDTKGPVVSIPSAVRLDATGVLTWSGFLGRHATITDADPSPEIEFYPEFLEIGNNTVSWTATDSSNNTAGGTLTVTVSLGEGSNALDTDWHYKATQDWAIAPTKGYGGQIHIGLSDVYLGNLYLFKSFSKDDIRNSTIAVDLYANIPERVDYTVSVNDGRLTASDFGGSGPASRGGGTLASFENDAVPDAIVPDWSRSQLDEVTLVITVEKRRMHAAVVIESVTISNHSKWVFTDYKVDQHYLYGTYVLDIPSEDTLRVHALPVYDTFSGSAQSASTSYTDPVVGSGWTYWGHITDPTFGIDTAQGNLSPSAYVSGDEFSVTVGIGKTVDTSGLADGQRLVVSYDYRATSRSSHSTVTQAQTFLYDADTERRIGSVYPMAGGTRDTGWQSYKVDVTDYVAGIDNLRVVLGFHDSWAQFLGQKNWFDNVRIYAVNQTEPVETVNTYADSRSGRSDVGGSSARGMGSYNSTLGL